MCLAIWYSTTRSKYRAYIFPIHEVTKTKPSILQIQAEKPGASSNDVSNLGKPELQDAAAVVGFFSISGCIHLPVSIQPPIKHNNHRGGGGGGGGGGGRRKAINRLTAANRKIWKMGKQRKKPYSKDCFCRKGNILTRTT